MERAQAAYSGGVDKAVVAPPTRAEWVDSLLRRAIVHGELAPGEKLYAERLAEQWGVSATPLRETFQRLAGEGLVVIEPQRGARVAPVGVEQAAEIYEMRLLLDPVAIEQSVVAAVEAGDLGVFAADVRAAHRALEVKHRSVTALHDAHTRFHMALVARCPNQRMLAQIAQLLEHSQRFQVVRVGGGVRVGDARAEHRQLCDAAAEGRATEAAAVLRSHLSATLAAVCSAG